MLYYHCLGFSGAQLGDSHVDESLMCCTWMLAVASSLKALLNWMSKHNFVEQMLAGVVTQSGYMGPLSERVSQEQVF